MAAISEAQRAAQLNWDRRQAAMLAKQRTPFSSPRAPQTDSDPNNDPAQQRNQLALMQNLSRNQAAKAQRKKQAMKKRTARVIGGILGSWIPGLGSGLGALLAEWWVKNPVLVTFVVLAGTVFTVITSVSIILAIPSMVMAVVLK